jgi:NCS1 family nucleobase:cation symporter-1
LLSSDGLNVTGFFTSALLFFITMKLFPVSGMGEFDEIDHYGAFTAKEAAILGIVPYEGYPSVEGVEEIQPLDETEKGLKTGYVVADEAY